MPRGRAGTPFLQRKLREQQVSYDLQGSGFRVYELSCAMQALEQRVLDMGLGMMTIGLSLWKAHSQEEGPA